MAVLVESKRPRVLVHYPVIAALDESADRCSNTDEDGGIFLGSYRGPHLEITDYTHSGPADERRRYSFVRQDAVHQQTATKAWRKSHETVTFIGEWHTHPSGGPDPSTVDLDGWARLARSARKPMVFAVAAPGHWALYLVGLGAFQIRPKPLVRVQEGEHGAVFQVSRLFGIF